MILVRQTVKPVPLDNLCAQDLSREVFGLLGLAVDALSFQSLLESIHAAAGGIVPYLISTPNVNFLVTSRRNVKFRESLLRSDLCIADGMPLIWIARLLGIPIVERIAGADLFHTLKLTPTGSKRLRVFLFGGAEGVADAVAKQLNVSSLGLECVGVLNPGFGTIDAMSTDAVIEKINSSGADLLALFLGAEKAQMWLLQNHYRIKIPVRAQFGAAINFEAGTIKRAPLILRNTGLEWLWRIKEEPYLWRRYWTDGLTLLNLLFTSVMPLAAYAQLVRFKSRNSVETLTSEVQEDDHSVMIRLSGLAISQYVDNVAAAFATALSMNKMIVVDCANIRAIDPRFVGFFLMVRKQLVSRGQKLSFINVTPSIRRVLRINGFEFLLADDAASVG